MARSFYISTFRLALLTAFLSSPILQAQSQPIPLSEITIKSCDSEEMDAEQAPASLALDGKLDTAWISQWKEKQPEYPHEITLSLKTPRTISGIELTKRSTGANAPQDFQVLTSTNGTDWEKVFSGVFGKNNRQAFSFTPTKDTSQIKIIFTSSQDNSKHIALSEISLLTNETIPLTIDIAHQEDHSSEAWLQGGGTHPNGEKVGINALHWTKNDKPWTPVMGEFHFIRYPHELWEEELLKMKAGGVNIVATYIFWAYTESPQGTFDWTGNKDVKKFFELCKKHDLYVWLRPGPYINAEAQNGGLPEWINKTKKRSNDPAYLAEVKKYFSELAQQIKGLTYQEGGPIIGCQIENEFAHGQKEHFSTLKEMLIAEKINPPFFSGTANSEYFFERGDVIPFQGAYPYRFWEAPRPTTDYLYTTDEWGAMENLGRLYYDMKKFPRAMCELGGGCLNSYQHRFVIPAYNMEGSTQNVLGRGMNLVGYYMYQGGSQPEEWGLVGGCPQNYDYQAQLGEFGQRREAYHKLKLLHFFMNDFGDIFGPTLPVRPENPINDPNNNKQLRYVGRFANDSGFLFMNTCQPWVEMNDIPNVQFNLQLKNQSLKVPTKPITIPKNTSPIFPINLDLNGTNLFYSTAQLYAKVEDNGTPCFIFFTEKGITPEFCFAKGTQVESKAPQSSEGNILSYTPTPSRSIAMTVTSKEGKKANILLLSREEAEHSWRMQIKGKEYLLLSSANISQNGDKLELISYNPEMSLSVFPERKESLLGKNPKKEGAFSSYTFTTPKANITIDTSKLPAKTWTFTLPSLPENVNDIMVKTHYTGSTADLMMGEKRYTDHRHLGLPFEFTLNRFLLWKTKELTVKANPWDESVHGLPKEVAPTHDEEKEGMIRSVEIIPEYKITLPF